MTQLYTLEEKPKLVKLLTKLGFRLVALQTNANEDQVETWSNGSRDFVFTLDKQEGILYME